jgi:hypothetical protein
MAEPPGFLTLRRHRDLVGRRSLAWRRGGIAIMTLVLLAGLANVFGQRPETSEASVSDAKLKVYAASRVRGGLYYEARFTIDARRELKKATLVLDSGWAEGLTINTVEPSPVGEASRDGRLAFELGRIPAGETYLFFVQLQVNPTNVGRRSQDVALYDGERLVASISRTVTVFP